MKYRSNLTKRLIVLVIIFLCGIANNYGQQQFKIYESELRAKIEGYWLGQLVGNYMGFPFEFIYSEQSCPILIDRYYNVNNIPPDFNINTDRRGNVHILCEALGGAWTDDDTDIEFVTLHAVEKYGLDINYEQITESWKTHINRFIWGSNSKARELMDEGLIAPHTGKKENNPFWMFIDPQLVNEIWSVFYPGMIEKAVERAKWGAHITNDDWGTHPTIFYAALISGAFIYDDIDMLYDMGMESLPADSPFLPALKDVKTFHEEYPDDWRRAREMIYQKYYHYPDDVGPYTDISAIINGLFGAMAILYGEGDFVKTVGIATSAGLDCDNQAATSGALLGVLKGSGAIPEHLTTDMGAGKIWDTPFNNTYINFSRDNLPGITPISDIVDRILSISVTAIMENGGERFGSGENTYYLISQQ